MTVLRMSGRHCLVLLNLIAILVFVALIACLPSVGGQHIGLPSTNQSRPSLPDRLGDLNNRRHALAILVNQRQYERHVQMVNRMHERHQAVSQRVSDQHNRRLSTMVDRHETLHQGINERHLRRVNRTQGRRWSRGEEEGQSFDQEQHLDALEQADRNDRRPNGQSDHHSNRVRRSAWSSSAPLAEKYPSGSNKDEQAGVRFLKEHDQKAQSTCRHVTLASWEYNSNLTEHNKQRYVSLSSLVSRKCFFL